MANIQIKTKQQDNDIVAKKTSNYQQQKEATGNGQRNKIGEKPKYSDSEQQGKDDKTYNFRTTSTRAKIETKKRGKEDNINSELAQEENSDISNRDVCPLCNRPVKTGVECGICSRWFHYKCEGTTEERVLKEYPHETHYICKKDNEQKQLEVAIRDLRKQLKQQEEKRTEIEVKYKNLQKIHECTKKENKIYETEILKLKHERGSEKEVMKALRNANFNKIQISSATDKEQQIQKLNTILEKEQGMKKIMVKDNIELKAQNQTLQTKMRENQEKYDEDLKILCKAK